MKNRNKSLANVCALHLSILVMKTKLWHATTDFKDPSHSACSWGGKLRNPFFYFIHFQTNAYVVTMRGNNSFFSQLFLVYRNLPSSNPCSFQVLSDEDVTRYQLKKVSLHNIFSIKSVQVVSKWMFIWKIYNCVNILIDLTEKNANYVKSFLPGRLRIKTTLFTTTVFPLITIPGAY